MAGESGCPIKVVDAWVRANDKVVVRTKGAQARPEMFGLNVNEAR
jgi:hypothetical protein